MFGRKKFSLAVAAIALAVIPGDARTQTLSTTSVAYYGAGSTGTSLMLSLGFSSACEFYYLVTVGTTGSFPLSILSTYFPQCVGWTPPTWESGEGQGGGDGSGYGGEESGEGSSLGTGGGGTGGGGSDDPADDGDTGSGNGDDGGEGTGGDSDDWPFVPPVDEQPHWTGGGGAIATPEPVSLLLLGTGLAGIGGVRVARRRKTD